MIYVFKNVLSLIYQKQITMKILLIILLAACFASCGSSSYSPLDNYIKANNYSDSANAAYKIEMQKWIDSTNGHIVIHNRQKF